MIDYLVYDVFTNMPFTGNPLAIIPDASGLTEDQLLPIAREFNFSETAFVYPPENPESTAKVRIFTPATELAFAGHPTVGTAVALSDMGRASGQMIFDLGVGPIPVTVCGDSARFTTRVPLKTAPTLPNAALANCIGLPASTIRTDHHAPIVAGLGTDFTLIELEDQLALASTTPRTDAFREAAGPDADRLALFIYTRSGCDIRARMFQPLGGIPEDPATGSAAAALAAFLGQLDGQSATFDITQGVEMGRPSKITAEIEVEDAKPTAVSIEGQAVRTMQGRLAL